MTVVAPAITAADKLRVAVNHLRAAKGFLPLGEGDPSTGSGREEPGHREAYDAFVLLEAARGPKVAAWLREHAPEVADVLCPRANSGQ